MSLQFHHSCRRTSAYPVSLVSPTPSFLTLMHPERDSCKSCPFKLLSPARGRVGRGRSRGRAELQDRLPGGRQAARRQQQVFQLHSHLRAPNGMRVSGAADCRRRLCAPTYSSPSSRLLTGWPRPLNALVRRATCHFVAGAVRMSPPERSSSSSTEITYLMPTGRM